MFGSLRECARPRVTRPLRLPRAFGLAASLIAACSSSGRLQSAFLTQSEPGLAPPLWSLADPETVAARWEGAVAAVNLETSNEQAALYSLLSTTISMGGVVLRSGAEGAVLQVPPDQFEHLLDRIFRMGRVSDFNLSRPDLPETSHESNVKRDNAEKVRLRYLELLAKAEDVSEIHAIEAELDRLATQLESAGPQRDAPLADHRTCTVAVQIFHRDPGSGVERAVGSVFGGLRRLLGGS